MLFNSWYKPGPWRLPAWWTSMPPGRKGRLTHAEQAAFYSGWFVRDILGHKGGITVLPETVNEGQKQ